MSKQRAGKRRNRRDKLWGGTLLIAAGVFLLLVQYDGIREFSIWNWWPLWPIGIGVWKLARWDDPEELGSAVTFLLLGVWLMVSNFGWYGLTWRNSWPLALVAVGAGMVVRALASSLMASHEPPAGDVGGAS